MFGLFTFHTHSLYLNRHVCSLSFPRPLPLQPQSTLTRDDYIKDAIPNTHHPRSGSLRLCSHDSNVSQHVSPYQVFLPFLTRPNRYGNGTAPIYPSGTVGTAAPSGTTGTGATTTASFIPNTGAASRMSTGMGAMGLAIVGGVAMVRYLLRIV